MEVDRSTSVARKHADRNARRLLTFALCALLVAWVLYATSAHAAPRSTLFEGGQVRPLPGGGPLTLVTLDGDDIDAGSGPAGAASTPC